MGNIPVLLELLGLFSRTHPRCDQETSITWHCIQEILTNLWRTDTRTGTRVKRIFCRIKKLGGGRRSHVEEYEIDVSWTFHT
jgi:hypothetical protein